MIKRKPTSNNDLLKAIKQLEQIVISANDELMKGMASILESLPPKQEETSHGQDTEPSIN